MQDLIQKGSELLEKGEYAQALEAFNSVLETAPNTPNVLCLRGVVKRKLEQFGASIEDFRAALVLWPDNANIYSEIAVTQFHQRDLKGALLNMNRAQSLEPENPYRYSSRAYIKDAMGDVKGAIEDYQKTIQLDPEDAVAYNNLGMLEEKLGRLEAAKKNFATADELSKDEESPFFGKFNADGTQILDKEAAKQEVEKVIKEAQAKKDSELREEVKIRAVKSKGIQHYMLEVFKSKNEFKNFIQFILNGFKNKKD